MSGEQLPGEVLTHTPQKSLRDDAAFHALNGLCARLGYHPSSNPAEIAKTAYGLADAMLNEREK